jgi:hypothetical protein
MNDSKESFKSIAKEYEKGLKLLYDKKFADAKKEFESVLDTQDIDPTIRDRAGIYINICDRSQETDVSEPENESDFITRAAYNINRHEADDALDMLKKAEDAGVKNSDSIHYLRAQAFAILEKYDDVLSELKKSIKINADNRIYASNDLLFSKAKAENDKIGSLLNIDDEEEKEEKED